MMFINQFGFTGTVKGGTEATSIQRLKTNAKMQLSVTDSH